MRSGRSSRIIISQDIAWQNKVILLLTEIRDAVSAGLLTVDEETALDKYRAEKESVDEGKTK